MPERPTPEDDLLWGSLPATSIVGDADSWMDLLSLSRAAAATAHDGGDVGDVISAVRPPSHLEVLGPLGVGGMGEVLRVADHRLRRIMALKTLHTHLAARPDVRARFIEEAQATAQLAHPGIIPVHELGELEDGRPFFTMKQVEGRTLAEVLTEPDARPALLRIRRLVDLFGRVCEIVGYAHSRSVVHRDLKPDNVMIGAFGEVLVLDWGLVQIRGSRQDIQTDRQAAGGQTRLGLVSGTPRYMSPEQARGEPLDARSDVYTLGVILFEILAGQTLQPQRDMTSLMEAVSCAAGRRPLPAEVPVDLARIVEHALAGAVEERPRDAGVLAAAVHDWLDGAQARERALVVVEEALRLEPAEQAARAQAARLEAESSRVLSGLPPAAPAAEKRVGWALADEAAAAEQEAARLEVKRLQQLNLALSHSPELPEALSALAAHHRRKHAAAEASGEAAAAALHRQQLAFYDRGEHRAWLSGEGALTLQTDPPGAQVTLHRLSLVDRQLKAGPGRGFGQTPLSARLLPMGRYLLRLEHPDCDPTCYPILITRQHHWDGVPPGGEEPAPVILPPAGSLGEDDVYVPAGWALLGGGARLVAPRHREWVEGFVIRRFPVTNREYLAFLDALVASGREEEALRWVPRARAGRTGEQGAMVYGRRPDGTFELVPDADGDLWLPDWPVVLVRGDAGAAYAAWLRARTGVPWQLPPELWWEKAARGVDGRFFPWGGPREASFANVRDRNPDRPLPEVVGSSPADRSPYGVFDTAGNVREWCADRFQVPGEPPRGNQQTVRGGCFFFWSDNLCARLGLDPQVTGDTIGFRLAARPGWLSPRE